MKEMKYSEIIKQNASLGQQMNTDKFPISVLSNIMVDQIKDIGEYFLKTNGLNAELLVGDYDNILQESQKTADCRVAVIFWEAANLLDGFQYRADSMKKEQLEELLNKTVNEIDFVLKSLADKSLVIFNSFSSNVFNSTLLERNNFDHFCDSLNSYLKKYSAANLRVIDIDRIISNLSVAESSDMRFYYSSKSLYTVDFFKAYVSDVFHYILSACGKTRKALIFDCDNTLWKGILGEDGIDNIEMSGYTPAGAVYKEIQYIALQLKQKGVILGICSKNNPQDVDQVFAEHPSMTLREEDIAIRKVNWNDKVSGLKQIAEELNIGLDSLVFVDDSKFEIEMVNEMLPQVHTILVPKKLSDYPAVLRSSCRLFLSESQTHEDRMKTKIYSVQAVRKKESLKFENVEDYLKSLELRLTVKTDDKNSIQRLAQLTQKTNQFNLTTKRYTVSDISKFMNSDDHIVFSFELSDKYGSYGITGLSIVQIDLENLNADIDTFLMSCRVIGRNVEFSFFRFIVDRLKEKKIQQVKSHYIQTLKNKQAENFFENCGCGLVNETAKEKHYKMFLDQPVLNTFDYIGVVNGRQD